MITALLKRFTNPPSNQTTTKTIQGANHYKTTSTLQAINGNGRHTVENGKGTWLGA